MSRIEKYTINVSYDDFGRDFIAHMESKGLDRLHKRARENTSLMMKVLGSINTKIMNEVAQSGYKFKMPYNLGTISVVMNETPPDKNRLKIDWNETKKMWDKNPQTKIDKKLVYFLNQHSNGVYARYFFQKHHKCNQNMNLYSFIPSGGNKKLLSAAMRSGDIFNTHFINRK